MKSKIEIQLNEILKEKYIVKYEPTILYGSEFSFKVDFSVTDNKGNIYYLEYSGMNFLKKYLKITDVIHHNKNVFIIYDDENLKLMLDLFYSYINSANLNNDMSKNSIDRTINRINTFYTKFNQLCI